jgi:hypothetical protein
MTLRNGAGNKHTFSAVNHAHALHTATGGLLPTNFASGVVREFSKSNHTNRAEGRTNDVVTPSAWSVREYFLGQSFCILLKEPQ